MQKLALRPLRLTLGLALMAIGVGAISVALALVLVRRGPSLPPPPRVVGTAHPSTPVPATSLVEITVSPRRPPAAELDMEHAPVAVISEPRRETSSPVRTYLCRESAVFNVDPEEALVTVDGRPIGIADDWDDWGRGRKYRFQRPGTHHVKLSHRGHTTTWVAVVVTPSARSRTADVDLELPRLR